MNSDLLLVAFLGFSAGYVFKTLVHGFKTLSMTATFVQKIGYQALILLATSVYKMSYIDQMCALALERVGEVEEAKKLRLEHEHQFNTWKEEIVEEYVENYPETYKWQLQFDDWKGMMDELTNIYKEKKV
jgi:hypothetical protein|tara:strand:- start:4011 stop:4400 length:390 start_codon:yes stop_codon:yes gene_type:complete